MLRSIVAARQETSLPKHVDNVHSNSNSNVHVHVSSPLKRTRKRKRVRWWTIVQFQLIALFSACIILFMIGQTTTTTNSLGLLGFHMGIEDMLLSATHTTNVDIDHEYHYIDGIKRPICQSTRHLFHDASRSSLHESTTSSRNNIQDGVDTNHNMHPLTRAYLDAEKLHNEGGNLKAIEKYLDEQIDATYKMLDIQFIPRGSNEAIGLGRDESVADTILELLRANDVQKRGGYDQRLYPGTFEMLNHKYFNKKDRGRLDVIEPNHTDRWKAGLGPKFDICKNVDKIGSVKKSYEDKYMCSFDDIRTDANGNDPDTKSTNTSRRNEDDHAHKHCEMISIGSNGQWGFETAIAKMTNCITHTFDCTVQNPHKPNVESIKFYPYCVSSTNAKIDNREYMTYSKIIEQTGMTTPPTLFKMDVEGFEYDVMTQMLVEAVETGTTHLLPSQISVELHYATRMFDIPWMQRFRQASEIAMFMGLMYRKGGYLPVNIELFGPGCYSCAEVLFVRTFCDS